MKFRILSIFFGVLFLIAAGAANYSAQLAIGLNRIEGRVTDETNNGVYNAYVELYDNLGALINRQRSTGQGRFTFRGMGPGRYVVVVKPFGTNLEEDSKDIEINNQSSRSDTVIVDFRLRLDKRFAQSVTGIVGTVFAQDVPPDAMRLYKTGVDEFQSKPDQAKANLEAAIKIFPTYFDALAALGKAHIIQGKYADGYPFLLRAIDVNPKCSDCYYSLSLAFYKLDETVAAVKGINAAALLEPRNAAVRLLQGMIYRQNNDFAGAEKALLLAKSLFPAPNPEVHWQLSLVYNKLKRNLDAANELEEYLKIKPDMKPSEKENVRQLIAKLRNSK